MAHIESGSLGVEPHAEKLRGPLPEQQAQEKAGEIVGHLGKVSNRYMDMLGKSWKLDRLEAQGVDRTALYPKGNIYEDIQLRDYMRPQTEALVSWWLQHAVLPEDYDQRKGRMLLTDAMQPVDDAFTLARAYLHDDQQHPALMELTRALGVEALDEETIGKLRKWLPLHRTEADVTSSLPPTEIILRALPTLSMRLHPDNADRSWAPEISAEIISSNNTAVEPATELLAEQIVREVSSGQEVDTRRRERYVTFSQRYINRKWEHGTGYTFEAKIPRAWEARQSDKRQAFKALKRAIRDSGFTLTVNEAKALYANLFYLEVLPRALLLGNVSDEQIGELPPLEDGRQVQVIPYTSGRKGEKVLYSYDLSHRLQSPRGVNQRLADERRAREYIYQVLRQDWLGEEPKQEDDFAERIKLARGEVTRDEVNHLNLPPTSDGRFVVVRDVDGDVDEEKRYTYDLSLPRNEADSRTPEARERDRLRAIDMLEQALKKKREESS